MSSLEFLDRTGFIVVFAADKFIRTALVGSAVSLVFFWVLTGSLGGVETFGLLGLFIGPVILVLTAALLRDAIAEAGEGDAEG